jgi:coenzyme F420 hydrogenase subunit beta
VIASATDDALRVAASSGGAVTALLLSLKRQGTISGAVVTENVRSSQPPRTFLAREEDELRAASGSKYAITSLAEALREVKEAADGPFAVVGLPCQLQGVRRALEHQAIPASKIALTVGLFCGGTKDLRYYHHLLGLLGLRPEQVAEFEFRGGGWPGRLAATDTEGQTHVLATDHPGIGAIWSRARFTPPRCLVCDDPLAAHADLVVGDPWKLADAADPAGNSLVIIRTAAGQAALQSAVAAGDVRCGPEIDPADVVRSQTGILWRRHYAWQRAKTAALWAKGWREAVRTVPAPSLVARLKALRAFARSR